MIGGGGASGSQFNTVSPSRHHHLDRREFPYLHTICLTYDPKNLLVIISTINSLTVFVCVCVCVCVFRLTKEPLALMVGFGGWFVPSNIGVSAFGGQSLFGALMGSIGENLAHFPTGPALDDKFWLYMVTWHVGLFVTLTLAQIGIQVNINNKYRLIMQLEVSQLIDFNTQIEILGVTNQRSSYHPESAKKERRKISISINFDAFYNFFICRVASKSTGKLLVCVCISNMHALISFVNSIYRCSKNTAFA